MDRRFKVKAVSMLLLVSLISSCSREEPEVSSDVSTLSTETILDISPETTHDFVELPSDMSQQVPVVPVGDNGFTAPEPGFEITRPDRELYHYDMDLTFDPGSNTVGGHVVFTFYNDSEDSWDKLCLRDHSAMYTEPDIVGVEGAEGNNAAFTVIENITDMREETSLEYIRDEDVSVIWVTLEEPLEPCERMTLEYDFTATIPTVPDRDGVYEGVYNVTYYYPILSEYKDGEWAHSPYFLLGDCNYSEVSDYDVRITAPSDYILVTTGTEVSREDDGDLTTYTYYAPFVRDFVFCASKNFVVEEGDWEDVHINVVYSSETSHITDEYVESTLLTAQESLEAFSDMLGRYPYEELDVIISPIFAGGMEYPNLVIVSAPTMDPDLLDPWGPKLITVHEIGHQWFFGIVGSDCYNEPWLDESLTSYSEWLFCTYYADIYGEYDTDPYADMDITNEYYSSSFPLNRPYYEFEVATYSADVYLRGRLVLRRLEEIIGREEFTAVLREYVRRNAFSNADEEDFFEVLYDCCGTDNEELNAIIDMAFDL